MRKLLTIILSIFSLNLFAVIQIGLGDNVNSLPLNNNFIELETELITEATTVKGWDQSADLDSLGSLISVQAASGL
jgi:hypothetical protein